MKLKKSFVIYLILTFSLTLYINTDPNNALEDFHVELEYLLDELNPIEDSKFEYNLDVRKLMKKDPSITAPVDAVNYLYSGDIDIGAKEVECRKPSIVGCKDGKRWEYVKYKDYKSFIYKIFYNTNNIEISNGLHTYIASFLILRLMVLLFYDLFYLKLLFPLLRKS